MQDQDHLIQATAASATVRALAAVTTNLVNEACQRHGTSPTASAALGRTLTGALLLGKTFKESLDRLTLHLRCDGALGGVTAEASSHGTVRGYVRNPAADLPVNGRGKLDVSGIVGGGMLYVTREAGFEIGLSKEPYRSSTPIVSGEIAEDLAYYLAVSEQINSAVSLGVFVESEGAVTAAGGFLIQLMPGAEAETIAAIEESAARVPHITEMIRRGAGVEEILQMAHGALAFEVLEESQVEFRCTCSYDRALHIISCLDRAEVEDMLAKDQGAELICHFCNEVYWLDATVLEKILAPPIAM